ncbi:glucosamine-6-phosphate deaminase [Jeotgalibaca caeni]|uniref:glucosamine-6-phosphate deaminase n=1 Tax=Jeotgalibaca caeni TaxID=3028623 RepID=UPI00237E7ECF|nr:glucosamine-6-phosphate deaminase [Jeotgalibaca caeni]MDE1549720.1 glucosamine-6-phosphate deaminase [Jeotgalibaca caeni]
MQIITVKDQVEGGKKAFEIIKEAVENGASVLGLATGSTPLSLYDEIKKSELDFSELSSVNLDEYVGLEGENPNSYRHFMKEQLFNEKPFKNSYVPDGANPNAEEVIAQYNQVLKENPIDVQILGIGVNGHIGFNEPGTSFEEETHKVSLAQSTIDANTRFFDSVEEVPRYAYTMGPKSIMAAKKIILLAYGESKADAIQKTVEGPITEDIPASILQNHPDTILIVDEAAASKLSENEA